MSYSPYGCKELDMTEPLTHTHTHTHTVTHTELHTGMTRVSHVNRSLKSSSLSLKVRQSFLGKCRRGSFSWGWS